MKSYLEGQDFAVHVVPFPNCATDGAIMSDPDGFINIYVNSRVSRDRQRKALEHEIVHMVNDDLYSNEEREVLEGRMNG